MKLIIIGDSPSPAGNGMKSHSLKRLNKWMEQCGITNYSFINLNDNKTIDTNGYDKVVVLGKRVAKHVQGYFVPHPSPLNRLWNQPGFEDKVIAQLKGYLND